MENVIHDLKTQRQGVSGGLPGIYKLIPIAFYAGLVLSVVLSLLFYMSIRSHKVQKIEWEHKISEAKATQAGFVKNHQEIVDISKKAEDLAKWLKGSRPLQPVTTAIGRSMGQNSTISEVVFERNPEITEQILLQLKINGGGTNQIETTIAAIKALNYQIFSSQHVKGRNNAVDFQTRLAYDDKK